MGRNFSSVYSSRIVTINLLYNSPMLSYHIPTPLIEMTAFQKHFPTELYMCFVFLRLGQTPISQQLCYYRSTTVTCTVKSRSSSLSRNVNSHPYNIVKNRWSWWSKRVPFIRTPKRLLSTSKSKKITYVSLFSWNYADFWRGVWCTQHSE
jgi:hypothetical protein